MFLRKKPNESGSTSVQVIVKTKNRKQRVVKTIGSSRDTDEIERLMAEGRKYISDQNGPLFPGIDEDEKAVDAFVGSLTNSQIKVVGPELIFRWLYDYIGFNSISSEMFRHMGICRLFNPGSKLKTVDYLERYLHVSYNISKIYRFLDNLCYRKDTKFETDAAWDGIKGYVTNTRLTPEKVIESYGNLWLIERAFRFNKFDLAVRPIYHRLRNRIEGHICICFTAYTILLELERILKAAKSDITIHRAQELTKNMYAISYILARSKQAVERILGMDEEQRKLYDLIDMAT